jgi:peptide/nickel transport system substrate-binding protein
MERYAISNDLLGLEEAAMLLGIDREFDILRRTILSFSIALLFGLSAFQALVPNASAAEEARIFYIGMGESVTSANPFVGFYESDHLFCSYIYDELIFPDEDGKPTPNLAKSWWYMDGDVAASLGSSFVGLHNDSPSDWPLGSIWEYNLTENVFWNDGEPFTADDVVFTMNIQIGTNYINYWAFQPYTKWIYRCEKINDLKVRIFFADHSSHVPTPVAWGTSISIPIMPAHKFTGLSDNYIAWNWTGRPTVGTGPFVANPLPKDIPYLGESITLEKNPFYDFINETDTRLGLGGYYNRTIQIDKLVMKFYAEEQPLILDLKARKLDASEVAPTNYFALKESKPAGLTLVLTYSPTVYSKISHFNVNPNASGYGVFSWPYQLNPTRLDPALLRATAIATNKSYICEAIFKGLATPGVGILSPVWPEFYWTPPHDKMSTFNITDGSGNVKWNYTLPLDEVMSFNLSLANEILDEAGYVWTNGVWSGINHNTSRKVGPEAADRLVNMGFVGNASAALNKTLEFEDVYEIEVYEDKDTSEYLTSKWAKIGVKLIQKPVNRGAWWYIVPGFQSNFAETYWTGDPDPNYLLYVPTSYAMDGWNEFGTKNTTYDHYYDMQASSMNLDERKYWVDKCQEWQYLSGSAMMVTCYPKSCFAYNDQPGARWVGWGNWTQHPGLAIDHYWGETPLFYHIKWQYETPQPPPFPFATVAVIGVSAVVAAFAVLLAMKAVKTRKMKEI